MDVSPAVIVNKAIPKWSPTTNAQPITIVARLINFLSELGQRGVST